MQEKQYKDLFLFIVDKLYYQKGDRSKHFITHLLSLKHTFTVISKEFSSSLNALTTTYLKVVIGCNSLIDINRGLIQTIPASVHVKPL